MKALSRPRKFSWKLSVEPKAYQTGKFGQGASCRCGSGKCTKCK